MKKRKDQKPPVQTTIDEFTGGDMLVGTDRGGATIKAEPRQGDLFQETPQQLHFEISDIPSARSLRSRAEGARRIQRADCRDQGGAVR